MTRQGAAIGLAYGLAAIVVFVSVVAMWSTAVRPEPSSVALAPTPEPTSSDPAPPATLAPSSRPSQRPTRQPPTATARPTVQPNPRPLLTLRATFYCLLPCADPTVLYAAAGPKLRDALGDWRGRDVTVWRGSRHVTVTLVDSCACGIDLSASAFALLAPLSLGVLDVEVRW